VNGAEALLRTLVGSGIDVCFANPGTSEMQFVAALDRVPEMRAVLTLFEDVATGAADGFGRMAERPASTLLHLGPGLANGLSNLHNARRAQTPLVNVVGDQATYHQRYDARLQSDLAGIAKTMSAWVRSSTRAEDVGGDAADAVAASWGPPGSIATLIVPADVSWSEGGTPCAPHQRVPPPRVPDEHVEELAKAMRDARQATLLLGGPAMTERGILAAVAIARGCGARLLADTFPARQPRGGGLPELEKLAYYGEMAATQLAGTDLLVLVAAKRPASFFAYPGKPSDLVPPDAAVAVLGDSNVDTVAALEALAEALGNPPEADGGDRRRGAGDGRRASRPERPAGRLDAESMAAAVGHALPEGSIVVDESITSGLSIPAATAGGPGHDWLALAGGSLGQGLPVATGAAIAAPGRRVLSLEADGSAMYTFQALWTQAREGLDVTTVVLANRSYAILQFELHRLGASGTGERAASLLDLTRPDLDFVALGRGLGVPAVRAETAEELTGLLERSFQDDGPMLIEALFA